jgi:hypothetical protein
MSPWGGGLLNVQSLGGQGTSVDTYVSLGLYPNLPSIL